MLQHWLNPVTTTIHLDLCQDQPIALNQRGGLCVLGTRKTWTVKQRIPRMRRQLLININSCVRSSTCTKRGRVWNIKHGLVHHSFAWALLLDELWSSTWLAKTVKSCIIKSEIEIRCKSKLAGNSLFCQHLKQQSTIRRTKNLFTWNSVFWLFLALKPTAP